jgi:hypothetical protein
MRTVAIVALVVAVLAFVCALYAVIADPTLLPR